MGLSDEPGDSYPSKLRNFVAPQPEMQRLIEEVAEFVSHHGIATEYQLRSGSEGRQQFPFLFLDDQYAPYYQYKLRDARRRRQAATTTHADGKQGQERSQHAQKLNEVKGGSQSPDIRQHDVDAMARLHRYTYGEQQTRTADDNKDIINEHAAVPPNFDKPVDSIPDFCSSVYSQTPRPTTSEASPANNHSPPPPPSSTKTTTSAAAAVPNPQPTPTPTLTLPYGLLQEVHLLDSTGTELSGLTTYRIISNTAPATAPPNSLHHHLYHSPIPVPIPGPTEPIYRLRPDTTAVFRATHSRLLPVGFALGAEVELVDEDDGDGGQGSVGVVTRRTVRAGRRLYDILDEERVLWAAVDEGRLRLHTGGRFGFRVPN